MAERKISHKVSFSALAPPVIEISQDGDNRFKVSEVQLPPEPDSTELSSDDISDPEQNKDGDTYVSRYARTLSQLTEALPRFEHFRNLDSLGGARRPGIEELHQGLSGEQVICINTIYRKQVKIHMLEKMEQMITIHVRLCINILLI